MNEDTIRKRLVLRGQALLETSRGLVEFTKVAKADQLLNDIEGHPHAFVLGCVMDRGIKAEKAWLIPHLISEKLGGFSLGRLAKLSQADVLQLMSRPAALHRYTDTMSRLFYAAVHRISEEYEGDASQIWADRPSSAHVVYHFLQFDGVGPKIASMAVNILARHFKVAFSDFHSIAVSADVHVRRVFGRLGLCRPSASVEEVIFRARALNPAFPGIVDFPCWEIGRSWCRTQRPLCESCYMHDVCPSSGTTLIPA